MAYASLSKNDFTSGEWAETLLARTDLEQYRSGASKLRNVLVIPHGGVKRRPGLLHQAEIKYQPSVRRAPATNTDAAQVHIINDLTSISALEVTYWVGTDTAGDANACFNLGGYQTDEFSSSIDGGTGDKIVTISQAWIQANLPGAVARTTDRIIISGNADATSCSYDLTALDTDVGVVPGQGRFCKFADFKFSDEQTYVIVFTAHRAEVFLDVDGTYVSQTTMGTPYRGEHINDLTFAQSLDTLVIFHKRYPMWQILRSSTGWPSYEYGNGGDELTYPQHDFVDSNSPSTGIDHVERIGFSSGWLAEDEKYSISLDGTETESILRDGSGAPGAGAANEAAIKAGIEALSTVGAGDVTVTYDILKEYTITMSGDSGDRLWDFDTGVEDFNNTSDEVNFITDTKGQGNIEDAWSAPHRGFPRCGTFFQNRLFVGGSYSLPNYVWSTRSGTIYNFDSTESLADYGIAYAIGSNQVNAVNAIYPGRHLMVLTEDAEFYVPVSISEGITPENFFIRRTSEYGILLGSPPREVGGTMLFADKRKKSVYEHHYEERQQSYVTSSLSKFAPHLLPSVRSVSFRKALTTIEADYVYVVNDDGTLAVLNSLPEENVNAWSQLTTDGWFWETAVDEETSLFAVWRNALSGGTPTTSSTLHLETFDEELLLDSAVKIGDFTLEGGTNAAEFDIDHLADATVVEVVAGSNSLYRTKGTVTTDDTSGTNVGDVYVNFDSIEKDGVGTSVYDNFQAGLAFPVVYGTEDQVWVQLLPYDTGPDQNSVRGDATSIADLVLRLYRTQHCRVHAGTSAQTEAVTLRSSSAVAPNSIAEIYAAFEWFSGIKDIEGLQNWDESSMISITQRYSLPFTLLGVTYKVVS